MDVSMVLNLQKGKSLQAKGQAEVESVEDVTSKAIVQYSESNLPANFKQLKQNTDLNSAPDNWLQSNLIGKFVEGNIDKRSVLDFSSFSMTRNYLDYVGKIDVISDADNIRQLLKTPYSDGCLSMAVHRIRNTLLINELDIPKLISAVSDQNPKLQQDLEWLKNLYCEVSNTPTGSEFQKAKRSQEVDSRNILSKFLHYSIAGTDASEISSHSAVDVQSNIEPPQEADFERITQHPNFIPNVSTAEDSSSFNSNRSFQRNMLWNFEDITMLVGSNLPIFGGGRFPAVSLRLRDAKQPVNILTGLDYWLDNLMCNVPELVMCYHLEGIVQKYEVLKTEDLPKLDECGFSPKVVKDIAQDVLSFLKSKCTKEGHTYWLFKGSKSDVVKLYDLTSICNEAPGDSKNPYTIPVTSLLYRIARNMIANGISSQKEALSAISLLQNCILLLENEDHPELMMAANYLLAFLYMQEDLVNDEAKSDSEDQQDESSDQQLESESESEDTTDLFEACKEKELALPDNVQMDKALQCYQTVYSAEGTRQRALTYDPPEASVDNIDKTQLEGQTYDSQPWNSVVSVPKDSDKSMLELYGKDLEMTVAKMSICDNDWVVQLKIFGIHAYTSLAELSINKAKYGRALRYAKIGFLCIEDIRDEISESLMLIRAKLSMICGDISLIFAHKRNVSYEEYTTLSKDDDQFMKICSTIGNKLPIVDSIEAMFKLDSEQLLIETVSWYERSLEQSPSNERKENVIQVVDVTARLGNIRNELGVFYMNLAAAVAKNYAEPSKDEQQFWRKSFDYFEKGIKAFDVIDDRPNIALIYSNVARLMRVCAKSFGNSTRSSDKDQRGSFTSEEKLYFNKAFEFYQKAFTSLRSRQAMQEVWDRISFELSGAYFSMACLLQDYPPLQSTSQEEVFKDVQSLMMKALHYCEEDEKNINSPRHESIRMRIGKYQDVSGKKFKSLAELHYNKAYSYLNNELLAVEFLRTVTEHVALHTHGVTTNTSNYASNVKKLKSALNLCITKANIDSIKRIIHYFCKSGDESVSQCNVDSTAEASSERNQSSDPSGTCNDIPAVENMDDYSIEETFSTMEVLEKQLNSIFKDLIANLSSKSAKGKSVNKLSIANAKKMFEIFIRGSTAHAHRFDMIKRLYEKCNMLIGVMEKTVRYLDETLC
eukprot:gene5439-6118_t